jgi:hypothetical protein
MAMASLGVSISMRVATLLLCLLCPFLAGCLANGDQPAPQAATPAPAAAVAAAPSPAARSPAGSAGGPRGGATTAAARGEPEEVPPDPVIQARTDCWMAVEHQKSVRSLDQRIAYVDKCVADQMKTKPNP